MFGTLLVTSSAAGTPSKKIALLMGHASTTTTDVYIQSAGPQVAEAWMRHAVGAENSAQGVDLGVHGAAGMS